MEKIGPKGVSPKPSHGLMPTFIQSREDGFPLRVESLADKGPEEGPANPKGGEIVASPAFAAPKEGRNVFPSWEAIEPDRLFARIDAEDETEGDEDRPDGKVKGQADGLLRDEANKGDQQNAEAKLDKDAEDDPFIDLHAKLPADVKKEEGGSADKGGADEDLESVDEVVLAEGAGDAA